MAKTKKRPKRLVVKKAVKRKSAAKRRRPIHKRILLHPASLLFLLCVGILLTGSTLTSHAATSSTISTAVEAPELTDPATIVSPADGATVSSAPIDVTGTCPADSYVELYKSGQFSGVALCNSASFEIQTDLFEGVNVLIAQDYNFTDEAGSTGSTVNVTYNVPAANSSSTSSDTTTTSTKSSPNQPSSTSPVLPLLIKSQYRYRATPTGKQFVWPISLGGGFPPYQVTVNWGDSSSTNYGFNGAPSFNIYHTYQYPGAFVVIIKAADTKGNKASLQLLAIINSPLATVAYSHGIGGSTAHTGISSVVQSIKHHLTIFWPCYLIVVTLIFCFWLGEHEELRQLHRKRLA